MYPHSVVCEMPNRRIILNSRFEHSSWIFLELMGFIAFLGILLIQAESYRMELTMCILTVFSISLFTCVLADLDQPYHGFFRVDLRDLEGVVESVQEEWTRLLDNKALKEGVVETSMDLTKF